MMKMQLQKLLTSWSKLLGMWPILSRALSLVFLLLFAVTTQYVQAAFTPNVIYGKDNRVDVRESKNSDFVDWSKSTAAFISKENLKLTSDGSSYEFVADTLQATGVCSTERFAQQSTAASCSGFLVADDVMVTAGHCLYNNNNCGNMVWVFDYMLESVGQNCQNLTVARQNVVACKEVLARVMDSRTMDDYAIIRLERKVQDRHPLAFRREGKIADKAPLVVIGHPSGLPTKIADGAVVRKNTESVFFVANLDTYGGNSGSAVLNRTTGEVEGILVRGEEDYVQEDSKNCRVSKKCTNVGCRGEDVTRITNLHLQQQLQKLQR